MASPPDEPGDRTEALPPPEGTVDLPPASTPPPEDATGAWQAEHLDAGTTAHFTPGSPVAVPAAEGAPEGTGAWQPEPESGGGTTNFVPGEDPAAALSK